jgi:hypothetical protein
MLCTVGEVVHHDGGDRQCGKCLEDYKEPCPGAPFCSSKLPYLRRNAAPVLVPT